MTLSVQFITLMSMIGMGSFFAASFDTYNRFLKRSHRGKWLVFINDILFWCIQAIVIFFVLYQANYGEIRFYIVLAILCGIAIYQSLLKIFYLRILEIIIQLTKKAIAFCRYLFKQLVVHPIRLLLMIIKKICLLLLHLFVKVLKLIFALAKYLLKAVLSIVGVFIKPLLWLLNLIWESLPRKWTWEIEATLIRSKEKLRAIWKKLMKFFRKK